jgi:hypothetical protein
VLQKIIIINKNKHQETRAGPVAHTCNPSYSGGRDQEEDRGSKPTQANSSREPYLKKNPSHPDMKPHNYNQLIFDKGAKNIQWRKDSLFNKNCWENWLAVCKNLKLDPCLSSYTNTNSKWIKDLNIRPQTLKLVQERVGNTLELVSIGKNFLNGTPAAQ